MKYPLFASVSAIALAACGAGVVQVAPLSHRVTITTGTAPTGGSSSSRHTLAGGTRFDVTTLTEIASGTNTRGDTVHAIVRADVTDGGGHVVIPEGSPVVFTIAELQAGYDRDHPRGRLTLVVNSVRVDGEEYALVADIKSVPQQLVGESIGARASAAAASRRVRWEVVVPSGTPIVFALAQSLNVTGR